MPPPERSGEEGFPVGMSATPIRTDGDVVLPAPLVPSTLAGECRHSGNQCDTPHPASIFQHAVCPGMMRRKLCKTVGVYA